jgi:3-phosphoshikimate 1-carboxyvinyltransferase
VSLVIRAISHRYARLRRWPHGRPGCQLRARRRCHSTLACLRALGVGITEDGTTVTVMGRGLGRLGSPAGALDAGNSGTTMRMMAGILAAHPFTTTMIGDESLSKRPMRRVIEPLSQMGCRIDSTDGRPPLTIHGTALTPLTFTAKTPSAQVKSAILFAGLQTHGTTTVSEPAQTRDHTEQAFRAFGGTVRVEDGGRRVSIDGPQPLWTAGGGARRFFVRGVLFVAAAAALGRGSRSKTSA